jgi:hypothetical protein
MNNAVGHDKRQNQAANGGATQQQKSLRAQEEREGSGKRARRLFPVFLRVFVDFLGKIDRQKNRHDDDEANREDTQQANFITEQFLQHGSLLLQG